jgi:hypothetical protein
MADYTPHVHSMMSHLHKEKEHYKGKWHGLRNKLASHVEGAVTLAEVGAGAFLGGVVEGRTKQGTFLHVPINLGAGLALAGAGIADLAGDWSPHLINLGTGFIASYTAATGYQLGKKWLDTGKLFGGAIGAPAPAAALPPPAAAVPPAHVMAGIAAMQAAQAQGA